MIRSLWIAKTGMEGQQTKLDAVSNNLANVGTNGFKRAGVVFEDLMYQNLRQAGAPAGEAGQLPTGLQVGLGVRPVATSRQFTQGNLQQTENGLDVAIQGKGFFQVEMPDGTIGYTRDGSFKLDNQGNLVTNNGYRVLPGFQFPIEATNVTIGQDGTVSFVRPPNPTPEQLQQIELADFVNPAGVDPRGQNIFVETAASGPPQTGVPNENSMGSLAQGFVETSNVNVVQELVMMIQTQRAYELNSKVVSTSDAMLGRLTQL
jgi:flagellar basal-body rod protein FlgG